MMRAKGDWESRRAQGMTLLEVVLAMAIMVAVAGGLLLTLRTAVETSIRVTRVRDDDASTRGFLVLMRETFRTLPSHVRMTAVLDRASGVDQWTLVFDEPGRALAYGKVSFDRAQVMVQVRPQPQALLALQLVAVPRVLKIGQKPVPLVLLDDLEWVRWRFYDPRYSSWQEQWLDGGSRPSVVELKLKRQGRDQVTGVMMVAPASQSSGSRWGGVEGAP